MKIFSNPPTESERQDFKKHIDESFPNTASSVLAKSMLGKDIALYRIGQGKRNILSVGTHHAMEYISTLALYSAISKLSETEARGGKLFGVDIRFALEKFSLWVVPCVNPDGVDMHILGAEKSPLHERAVKMNGGEDFSDWQANARGVDLNHNYNYRFREYKELEAKEGIEPGKTRYSGEYPASEPESSALVGLVRNLIPELILSFHTQGEVIYPHFGKSDSKMHLARSVARILSYEISSADGLSAYGGFCDYTGEVLNIPSITVELGVGANPLSMSALPFLAEKVTRLHAKLPSLL